MYTVLIVEDETIVRKGIIQTIQWDNLGIDCILEARDGKEGLAIFKNNNVDIVITDMKMPNMNGVEFIQEIKKIDEKMPIMVISGYSDFEYLQSAIRYGATDYMLKPIRVTEINDSLMSIVNKLNIENIYINEEATLKENILYRIVQGMITKKEVKEKYEQLQIELHHGKYGIVIVKILGEPANSQIYTAAYMYNKILNRMQTGHAFVHPNKTIVIIYDSIKDIDEIKKNQKTLNELIEKKVQIQIKCYYGNIVEDIEEIGYSYQEANHKHENVKDVTYSKVIIETMQYIEEHYTENITLTSMSELTFVNPSYLGYLFKREVGVSFVEYVNEKRIDKAARYLLETNMKVYEIMDNIGITDKNYFLKLFKKYKGSTPTAYRKK